MLILMANAGVVEAIGDAAPDAWPGVVAYLLHACAVNAARPLHGTADVPGCCCASRTPPTERLALLTPIPTSTGAGG